MSSTGETSPISEQPPVEPELEPEISFEVLMADPELYRNRLVTVLDGLSLSRAVKEVEGQQAQDLVAFCLDVDNIDLIERPLFDLLSGVEPKRDDAKQIMTAIETASLGSLGAEDPELSKEKTLRLRLLAWVNLLGEAGSEPQGNGGSVETPPAASGF